MNPGIFIVVSIVTALLILISRNRTQVRVIALLGSLAQLVLSVLLFFNYRTARLSGDTSLMVLEQKYDLFPSLGISMHMGVDGISVAMILLTAFVVLAGVLV